MFYSDIVETDKDKSDAVELLFYTILHVLVNVAVQKHT